MSNEVTLSSASTSERIKAVVQTTADPTGNTVSWQLTSLSGQPNGAAWVSGSWLTSWVAPVPPDTNSTVTSASPLTGSSGFVLAQATDYAVWVQFTVGTETVIRRAGKLRVR